MGDTHGTSFYIKNNADLSSQASSTKTSFYFDSFGMSADNFLLQQLSKPITFQTYKLQDTKSILCGAYSL